ncbi:MAG TPA: transglutaminase family protein [Polyangiaceae bacterium]|nr:transglutaminase family protein [Polyangiaceae bacterium]
MKLAVLHRTTYRYASSVSTSHHDARLAPRASEQQRVDAFDISVTPAPSFIRRRVDYFGNRVLHFDLSEPHQTLEVVASSNVEIDPGAFPNPRSSPPWEQVAERLKNDRRRDVLDACQMTFDSPHVQRGKPFLDYAAPSFEPGRPLLDAVRDLTRRIHADFEYDPSATDVSTPALQVLSERRGVCQDFAHFMLSCLRSLGLGARYVSGYLLTSPPPGSPKLVGADASHAWVSVWLPDHGWLDSDPTNAIEPRDEHVVVAHGRDFSDVTPLRGVILGGGSHQLEVAVDVSAIG